MTAIVWLRRDLRLHDNPALAAAAKDHEHVVPAFCLDRRLRQGRNRSLPRSRFMLGCLSALSRDLAAIGAGLVVLSGSPGQAIPGLADLCSAEVVLAAADVSPFARKRDRAVADALEAAGRRLDLLPGTFVVDDIAELRTRQPRPV
ncbi:MAG TPA: deoxyribodipyrimidine photo-lyase [Solirubrobacteraceae bacterium]